MCDTFSGREGLVLSVKRSCVICYFERRRERRKEVKGLRDLRICGKKRVIGKVVPSFELSNLETKPSFHLKADVSSVYLQC